MSKSITEGGRVLHRKDCGCQVCQSIRDGTVCEQCGGPVLILESERSYSRVCQDCGASAAIPKSDVNNP